jgi:hypothetical protein
MFPSGNKIKNTYSILLPLGNRYDYFLFNINILRLFPASVFLAASTLVWAEQVLPGMANN